MPKRADKCFHMLDPNNPKYVWCIQEIDGVEMPSAIKQKLIREAVPKRSGSPDKRKDIETPKTPKTKISPNDNDNAL